MWFYEAFFESHLEMQNSFLPVAGQKDLKIETSDPEAVSLDWLYWIQSPPLGIPSSPGVISPSSPPGTPQQGKWEGQDQRG